MHYSISPCAAAPSWGGCSRRHSRADEANVVRIVLATRNRHKLEELHRILAAYDVELASLDDYPDVPDVAETGATFADNAILKAQAVASATGSLAVADDSGLSVEALNGIPGVLSARWAARHGDDAPTLQLVLAQVADV